ncbi:MAG: hypothetical protein QXW97_01995 [Candidatus Pacearchaeota archaeon]
MNNYKKYEKRKNIIETNKKLILIILISLIILILLINFCYSSNLRQVVPLFVRSNSNFDITYIASDVPEKWGAIIVQNFSGECFIDGKKIYKGVMLSTEGLVKKITVSTLGEGSCILSGYYQFSEDINPTNFQELFILIKNDCGSECSLDSINQNSGVSGGIGGVGISSVISENNQTKNKNFSNNINFIESQKIKNETSENEFPKIESKKNNKNFVKYSLLSFLIIGIVFIIFFYFFRKIFFIKNKFHLKIY